MLRLNISSQNAKIEINTVKPELTLHTTKPQIQISTQAVKVEISQPRGELEVDQSPCRASLGIRTISEVIRDFAEMGQQAVLQAIGNIAEEGNRLAAIEKEPDAIVNLAVEKLESQPGDLEIIWIDNPIINYRMNPPKFTSTPGQIALQLQRGTVQNDFQWGKANIDMAQYQSIKFWTTENKWDIYI